MTCDGCANKVKSALGPLKGISSLQIDVENNSVVIETTLPSTVVQSRLETTGLKTVLKGYGSVTGKFTAIMIVFSTVFYKQIHTPFNLN